jgi:FkbM family methyltransferase
MALEDVLSALKAQDEKIFKAIVEGNEYGVSKENVGGRRVLDAGANIGIFSVLAASLGAKTVLAIEPNRDSFLRLSENCRRIPSIHPLNFAVHNGLVDACDTVGEGDSCRIEPSPTGNVPAITLCQAVSLFPRNDNNLVLKMDIEGSEFEVLYHAGGLLIRRFQTICIEIHSKDKENAKNLRMFMRLVGYEESFAKALWWFEKSGEGVYLGQEVVQFVRSP